MSTFLYGSEHRTDCFLRAMWSVWSAEASAAISRFLQDTVTSVPLLEWVKQRSHGRWKQTDCSLHRRNAFCHERNLPSSRNHLGVERRHRRRACTGSEETRRRNDRQGRSHRPGIQDGISKASKSTGASECKRVITGSDVDRSIRSFLVCSAKDVFTDST